MVVIEKRKKSIEFIRHMKRKIRNCQQQRKEKDNIYGTMESKNHVSHQSRERKM